MNISTGTIESLLAQIQQGEAAAAMPSIHAMLAQDPYNLSLLVLHAEALRFSGNVVEAIKAYRYAGALGGGARNWSVAAILHAQMQQFDEAGTCLTYALAEEPTSTEALGACTTILLRDIQSGHAERALKNILTLLDHHPSHLGLMVLKAEALQQLGRRQEAIDAYRAAGEAGGGARNWLAGGLLLSGERRTDEALEFLMKAVAEEPGDAHILNALVVTLFQANRAARGVPFAMRLLGVGDDPEHISNAALLLNSAGRYTQASDAYRKVLQKNPDADAFFVGAAILPGRYTCDWDWIEYLQKRIYEHYARGEYAALREFPACNVTWCADEVHNLGVARAQVEARMPTDARPLYGSAQSGARGNRRIRVGYLSCDFNHHATMHLMAGVFEHHNRERFEVFAYDYTVPDESEHRKRFLDAVEHHVDITRLADEQAAARIAEDELDILIDLKGHTGWARLPILAYRPAPVQATYLGFPGTTGADFVDYQITDRFVTPDSSAEFYSEKLCRLPNSYQCNDRQREVFSDAGTRASHGLPEDAVVYCCFNQTYKIDRGSFTVWMRVLNEVPGSVLWLLSQDETGIGNLRRSAEQMGVNPDRLIFSPAVAPSHHLARLGLADVSLDTLICNGHTTSSDALRAGVPLVTARGRHFASRVSESLLNAMSLAELVGNDVDEMVKIAVRAGRDAAYRKQLRKKIQRALDRSPLYDTQRFTRNFEQAIEMIVEASRSGEPLTHIDVPEASEVAEPALA